MLDFPIGELITPEEQVAVARAVAIMASRDDQVSDSERHFVEELMGQMMLLPEERDQVRKEFSNPGDLLEVAHGVKHREARIFLYYQAVCAAMADNKLVEGELDALLQLAEVFQFHLDTAKRFLDIRGVTFTPHGEGVNSPTYAQQHLPVNAQREAVGHAVRAAYMYAAMAEVEGLLGRHDFDEALGLELWSHVGRRGRRNAATADQLCVYGR